MIAKITLYDGTVYKIASKTADTEDGLYVGRIKNELAIASAMKSSGNPPANINLTVLNYDNFILHTKDLWGAELYIENENNVSWLGKITYANFDADGNLYVTASEKTAPELELQLPDEVRQVYTVDENFHQSSVTMTIPLLIGGTTQNPISLSTILIDKTNGIYLICAGEIRSVVRVLNGSEPLPSSAYTAYTGTSVQTEHPGFAYVKISEEYRTNDDGSYAEINVDVVGLKLGNYTEEECRNPARFLYHFLTTPSSGVNGWGCGIDPELIDSNSFDSAITLCAALGFKLDGIMWLRQSAQSWIDQICQTMHARYSINANGKRSLFIDYAGLSSKKTFDRSNMKVEGHGRKNYTGAVYNKGIISYDYNPITGLFLQTAQYENPSSIAQIGEQKFVGESYLIRDPATALAALEYECKRSLSSSESIEFTTDETETTLRAGDVITINRTDLGVNGSYQISSISTTDFISEITAVKFDTSVFVVTGTTSSVNWSNEKNITPSMAPGAATNLSLSTGVDMNDDGTGTPYIEGTFRVPDGGWLAAAVQFGETVSPSDWTELSLITDGRFRISPVKAGTVYSVRVRMITATGHSDYISGQIRAEGDTDAPGIPNLVASSYLKTIRIHVSLSNPPSDLAGFEIYRSNIDGAYGDKIGYVSAVKGEGTYIDITAANYLTNFYYSAKAIDRWGNASDYSSQAVANCAKIQASELEADLVISGVFETTRNVGVNNDGVRFDNTGIEVWCLHNKIIDLNASGNSTIGGWIIGQNSLYNGNLELNSTGVIGTRDFASGHKGYQLYANGNAEFNDIVARGVIKSTLFSYDEISVVGGQQLISKGGVVAESYNPMLFIEKYSSPILNTEYAVLNRINDSSYSRETRDFENYQDYYGYENALWQRACEILDYSIFAESIRHEEDYSVAAATAELQECFTLLNLINDSAYTMPSLSSSTTYVQYVALEHGYWDSISDINDDPPAFKPSISVDDAVIYLKKNDDFSAGDIVRIKDGIIHDYWGKVKAKGSDGSGKFISIVAQHGSIFNMEAGQTVVNYGQPLTGGIILDGTSPKIDLFRHNGSPWLGTNLLGRIGNLKGANGISSDAIGFFFGNSDRSVPNRHYIMWNDNTDELEISGKLKAATGTFSGELLAASGSFSGRVVAESGVIGKFELINGVLTYTKNNLDFNDGSIVIQNPNVVIEGQNAGSFKTMLTLGGMKSEINFSNASNRGSYVIETGLNLDSSSSHYGDVETQYSHVAQNRLSQSNVIISNGYIDINTYNRTTASAAWNRTANFGISAGGISQTYKENNFDRTMQTSAFGFSINDSITGNRCSLTPTELFIGSNSASINLSINNTSAISGNLIKCHTIGLNGSGTGTIKTIGIALDSSYASSVPVVNIGVPSASYMAFSTAGKISVGGVNGNLEVTGYVKSNTLSTGAVSSSNGVLTGSAEESKTNIRNVSVLNRLKFLRVMQWKYKTDLNTLHIGPMAKDFNTLFKVNKESGEGINYTDSIGVALKAVQELQEELDDLKRKHRSLKRILLMKKTITENDFLQDRDFFVNLLIEKEKEVVDRIKNKTRRHILERLDYIRMEKEFNK